MKRPIAVLLTLAIGLVVVAGAQGASKKIRHAGELVRVDGTKVSLRVSVNKGRPSKVSAFKASGVPTRCDEGRFVFSFQALDPTRVTKKGNFKEVLKNLDGSKLTISGTVRKGGKQVSGFLKTNNFQHATAGTCKVPKVKFKTKKV